MEHIKAFLFAASLAGVLLLAGLRPIGMFAAGVAVVVLLDLAWRRFRAWRRS